MPNMYIKIQGRRRIQKFFNQMDFKMFPYFFLSQNFIFLGSFRLGKESWMVKVCQQKGI